MCVHWLVDSVGYRSEILQWLDIWKYGKEFSSSPSRFWWLALTSGGICACRAKSLLQVQRIRFLLKVSHVYPQPRKPCGSICMHACMHGVALHPHIVTSRVDLGATSCKAISLYLPCHMLSTHQALPGRKAAASCLAISVSLNLVIQLCLRY